MPALYTVYVSAHSYRRAFERWRVIGVSRFLRVLKNVLKQGVVVADQGRHIWIRHGDRGVVLRRLGGETWLVVTVGCGELKGFSKLREPARSPFAGREVRLKFKRRQV
ncbi:MAG: hypothetical protein DRN99_05540 [Thermoproteota archaeon]|nr:MAG: hypothetical protein DRN99_05540 [Candidatus Korarchaeota archaeon]